MHPEFDKTTVLQAALVSVMNSKWRTTPLNISKLVQLAEHFILLLSSSEFYADEPVSIEEMVGFVTNNYLDQTEPKHRFMS